MVRWERHGGSQLAPEKHPRPPCLVGQVYLPSWLRCSAVSTSKWFFCGISPGTSGGSFWHTAALQGNHMIGQILGLALGNSVQSGPAIRKKLPAIRVAGAEGAQGCPSCLGDRGEAETADRGPAPLLQIAGSDEGVGPTYSAQVDHSAVIGHLYRLPDASLAAF